MESSHPPHIRALIALGVVGIFAAVRIVLSYPYMSSPIGYDFSTDSDVVYFTYDLDGDGVADAAAASNGSGNVKVLLNDGSGAFGAPSAYSSGFSGVFGLVPALIDNDAIPDLVVTANDGAIGKVIILPGNGDGTFDDSTPASFSVGLTPASLVAANIDNANGTDVVTLNFNAPIGSRFSILLNDGTGSFTVTTTDPPNAEYNNFIRAGNLDNLNTSTDDLILVNSGTGDFDILLNDGAGTFTSTSYSFLAASIGRVTIGDIDGDTYSDLVFGGFQSSPLIVSVLNNGDGTFETSSTTIYDAGTDLASDPLLVDLNGDSVLDLIFSFLDSGTFDGDLYVMLGNGDGSFQTAIPLGLGFGLDDLVAGQEIDDLDGANDDDLAIFTVSGFDSTSRIYPLLDEVDSSSSSGRGSTCFGTITVNATVEGGTRTPDDVQLFLDGAGMDPDYGYPVYCTMHVISASELPGYNLTWAGACNDDGTVTFIAGVNLSCTAVYTSTETPTPTSEPTPTPTPEPEATGTPIALISPTPTPTFTRTPPPEPEETSTPLPTISRLPSVVPTIPETGPREERSGFGSTVRRAVQDACAETPLQAGACGTAAVGGLAALFSLVALLLQQELGAVTFSLLQVMGLRKKARVWGTVYDAGTKRPIPLAKMILLDSRGRVLETRYADRDGRYGFLLSPSTMHSGEQVQVAIRAEKPGYQFPASASGGSTDYFVYDHLYHGEPVQVRSDSVLAYNIPLQPVGGARRRLSGFGQSALGPAWNRILNIGFLLGIVLVPLNLYLAPTTKNWIILAVFLVANGVRITTHFRPYGTTIDAKTGKRIPFALVVLNEMDGRRTGFAVSDEYGRFILSGEKGHTYEVIVHTPANVVPAEEAHQRITLHSGWMTQTFKVGGSA